MFPRLLEVFIRSVIPILALTALVAGGPAGASVVKCKGPDGRISYQDSSCPHGARGDPVDATPNMGFEFATRDQIERARRQKEAEAAPPPAARTARPAVRKVHKVRNAAERRFIRTGMHAAEVRRKFGPPDEVAKPMSASGKGPDKSASHQWIYLPADEDPQTTTVLTVRKGMVLHVDRKVTY